MASEYDAFYLAYGDSLSAAGGLRGASISYWMSTRVEPWLLWLIQLGHDVAEVAQKDPRMSDDEILSWAVHEIPCPQAALRSMVTLLASQLPGLIAFKPPSFLAKKQKPE
jgi:hypothetical protein